MLSALFDISVPTVKEEIHSCSSVYREKYRQHRKYTSAIPYIDVFNNYYLSVSKKWAGGGLADIIKIVIHFLMKCRMSGGHCANVGNTAKICVMNMFA
jgi:hypothetical protein